MSAPLMETGSTVWQKARAGRIAFLVDAESYFSALADSMARARESVLILAWDIDSKLLLRRDGGSREPPAELAAYLSALLEARPGLEVHVLCWDYSAIYTLERELLPRLRMDWATHDRLHFELDGRHPSGASHHEKIVVVDDRVAFIGGIDLGRRRWDTPQHRPEDPRRTSPSGNRYPPFHDVQAVVEGPVAAALGDLARERWRRATGNRLQAPGTTDDPWPRGVAPSIRNLDIGIVRTRPEHGGQEQSLETETFYRRLFHQARELIYAENQYLTSDSMADALARTLGSDDPPEVLLVTAQENSGWLEKVVMGGLRAAFLRRLRDADRLSRLRVCYPQVGDGVSPNVHSKLTVVDDRWAYVGSANLSNRSMGLDTECGLAIGHATRDDVQRGLRGLRSRLLAEHLDVSRETLASRESELGLIAALESLQGGRRTLVELTERERELTGVLEPVARLADPGRPFSIGDVLDELV